MQLFQLQVEEYVAYSGERGHHPLCINLDQVVTIEEFSSGRATLIFSNGRYVILDEGAFVRFKQAINSK
jgi:hypothetical protein